jgi:hypothetical protein
MVLSANIIVSNKLMIEAYVSILLVVVIIHVLSVATKQEESVPDAGELTTTILVAIDARRWDADDLMRTVKGLLADAATPSTVCFTIGVRETSHYRRALPNNMQPRVRIVEVSSGCGVTECVATLCRDSFLRHAYVCVVPADTKAALSWDKKLKEAYAAASQATPPGGGNVVLTQNLSSNVSESLFDCIRGVDGQEAELTTRPTHHPPKSPLPALCISTNFWFASGVFAHTALANMKAKNQATPAPPPSGDLKLSEHMYSRGASFFHPPSTIFASLRSETNRLIRKERGLALKRKPVSRRPPPSKAQIQEVTDTPDNHPSTVLQYVRDIPVSDRPNSLFFEGLAIESGSVSTIPTDSGVPEQPLQDPRSAHSYRIFTGIGKNGTVSARAAAGLSKSPGVDECVCKTGSVEAAGKLLQQ